MLLLWSNFGATIHEKCYFCGQYLLLWSMLLLWSKSWPQKLLLTTVVTLTTEVKVTTVVTIPCLLVQSFSFQSKITKKHFSLSNQLKRTWTTKRVFEYLFELIFKFPCKNCQELSKELGRTRICPNSVLAPHRSFPTLF